MPRKTQEQHTFISLQDALQLWKDTEGYYGVRIELVVNPPKLVSSRWNQYFTLSAYSTYGEKAGECYGSFGLVYPSNDASTYPIALVTLLNRLAARLEARKAGKKEALEQQTLFG